MAVVEMNGPDRYAPTTPWHLRGNNAPVPEERTEVALDVVGALPPELNGRYFRNGANPITGNSEHWFIGDGMIHGLELSGGKANWYRNRWVETPMLANPGVDRTELSLDPETLTMDLKVSAANTHVIGHAGRIFALEEGAYPYELSKDLETLGPFKFDGALETAMTAHPKTCPVTGELLFFGYGVLSHPFLTLHRVSPDGKLIQSEPITMGGATMIHDFAISEKHTVIMDLPMVFDLELAMQGGMPIRWSDDYNARMGVMPRTGTDADVTWFDIDPCYVFHTLNAYDDGDDVVMTGCRMNEVWRDSSDMEASDPKPEDAPQLHEWRFNLATGTVSDRRLDDAPADFPRVADADTGLDARYGYCLGFALEGDAGEIYKYDLANDAEKSVHRLPAGHTAGESVFIPAEGATNPDDGYLMTYVHKSDTDTSYLAVLDASNMAADPIAEVHLPVRVPTGFHGSWIAD